MSENFSPGAEDRAALAALVTEYCWRADNYKADTLPELFTDDAVWDGAGMLMTGKAELEAGWKERAKLGHISVRRHLISNMRFVMDAPDKARGWIGFTHYRRPRDQNGPPAADLIGEHVDTYERGKDGRWRFKTRKCVFLFPTNWTW